MSKGKISIFLILAVLLTYISCRKSDYQNGPLLAKEKEERFFNEHSNTNPVIHAALNFVRNQNDKYHFLNSLVRRVGYPYWDKALLFENVVPPASRIASDTADVVYIPFAQESTNQVDAALRISMYPSDTTYKIITNWQYHDSASAGMGAKGQTLLLMSLDRLVFGHQLFKITDSTAFPMDSGRAAYVSVNTDISTGSAAAPGRTQLVTSTYLTICSEVWVPNDGNLTGCAPGEPCNGYHLVNQCTTWVVYDVTNEEGDGTGGAGGTGGTSGGNGGDPTGGGGWVPPTCTTNCSGGYIPVDDGPSVTEPVVSMLARYSRAINTKADSIFQLSMNSTIKEEWGFPFVQRNENIYPKRCTTIHRTQIVVLDRYIDQGERIIGELHTHPDTSSSVLNRSAPSGDDLETFNSNSRLNYTLFVECGNVRYALVIENVNLCRSFLAQNDPFDIGSAQLTLAQTIAGWQQNWQHATEFALVQLLGSSSACGIGFYKSDASKINFTKLN